MIRLFPFLLLTFLFLACGAEEESGTNDSESSVSTDEDFEIDSAKVLNPIVDPTDLLDVEENTDASFVMFEEFYLNLDSIWVYDPDEELKEIHDESANVMVEVGSYVTGSTMYLIPQTEGDFQVYQSYEIFVTIMNEGPHCDLLNWKHYQSDWVEIPVANGSFTALNYSVEQREKFVDVEMDELRSEVEKLCGEQWSDLLSETTHPLEYPSGVGINSIYLKIVFTPADGSPVVEKLVEFETPMGC